MKRIILYGVLTLVLALALTPAVTGQSPMRIFGTSSTGAAVPIGATSGALNVSINGGAPTGLTSITMANGGAIRTTTTAGQTFTLSGYNTSGTPAYAPVLTVAAVAGTPTLTANVPLYLPDGTAAAPALTFASATNKGLAQPLSPSAASLDVVYSGTTKIRLADGNWGAGYGLTLLSDGGIGWHSGTSLAQNASATPDLMLFREAAATLQLGVDAAGVTNQMFKGPDRITSDGVGGNLTIAGGRNRGASAGGSVIIQTSPAAGAGVAGTLADVATFASDKSTTLAGTLTVSGAGPHAIGGSTSSDRMLVIGTGSTTTYNVSASSLTIGGLTVAPSLRATGNLDWAQTIRLLPNYMADGSARTIAESAGIYIANSAKDANTTLTTNYGVYVVAQTTGATNWAIYTTGTTPSRFGGPIVLGDTAASTKSTLGLTLNQGANDDEILALQSSDVAHGMTDVADTDTYGVFQKDSDTAGALRIVGYGEGSLGLQLFARAVTEDSTKSSSGTAIFRMSAQLKSGTSVGSMSADANILALRNATSSVWIADADGDTWQSGTVTSAGYLVGAAVGIDKTCGGPVVSATFTKGIVTAMTCTSEPQPTPAELMAMINDLRAEIASLKARQ